MFIHKTHDSMVAYYFWLHYWTILSILTQDWYKNKLKEILLYSCFAHKLGFPFSRGGGMYTPDSKWQNYWIKTKISPGLIQQIPKWSLDQTLSPSPKKLSCKFTSLRIHFKLKEFLKGLTHIFGTFHPLFFSDKKMSEWWQNLLTVSLNFTSTSAIFGLIVK